MEHLIQEEKIEIDGLLIIIDNIDENPKEVVKSCDIFVKELIKVANKFIISIPLTILVSVREYNAKAYFYTHKHINTDLRNVQEHKVIYQKIRLLKEKIKINTNYPSITKIVDYNILIDGKFELKQKIIPISSNNVLNFLEDFAKYLFDTKDKKANAFLKKLSAGNMKILVANVFNLLHSNKLPLSELFEKHFIPNSSRDYKNLSEPFDLDTVLECLLSVHYPYFTSRESQIMNLFNITNSGTYGDFQEILGILRILLYLKNTGGKTVAEILTTLHKRYRYDDLKIEMALKKCFEYGIFETMYGVKKSQLDENTSKISLSTIGETYLDTLMWELIYYQYMCEDTYIDEQYYIPISEKYPDNINRRGSKNQRIQSALNLIHFIKKQELNELKFIEGLGVSTQHYLDLVGVKVKGKGVRIGELLENKFKSV